MSNEEDQETALLIAGVAALATAAVVAINIVTWLANKWLMDASDPLGDLDPRTAIQFEPRIPAVAALIPAVVCVGAALWALALTWQEASRARASGLRAEDGATKSGQLQQEPVDRTTQRSSAAVRAEIYGAVGAVGSVLGIIQITSNTF